MYALPEFLIDPNPEVYLDDTEAVTTDFETTNLEKGTAINPDNSIVLGVLRRPSNKYVSIWGDEIQQGAIASSVEGASFTIAHNAKFELQWLRRCGVDLSKILVWDTMIAEYILNGNKKVPLTLEETAKRYGYEGKDSLVSVLIKGGVCPSEIPKPWLEKYCIKDVELCHKVFLKQREEIVKRGLLNVMYSRCLLTPVLADIEFNGAHLDKGRVLETYDEYAARMAAVEVELRLLSDGINWNSTKQVAEYLYDTLKFKELRRGREPMRTPAGGRLTDSATLSKLKATNKKQRKFLELYKERNSLQAALSKNLEFFKGVVEERDEIFHAQFNQTVTATNRLSASGRKTKFEQFPKEKSCQFQNFPRKFKNLFSAREDGWVVQETDGGSLEFRTAAFLGRDTRASRAISENFDVHQFTADTLTGAGEPTNRQEAKAHTFKPLFGGSSGTDAQKKYYEAFREAYPGVAETQLAWLDEALQTKELKAITGFTFFFPGTRVTETGYVVNTANIYNYPIQQFATGDIIPIALIYQWHRMKAQQLRSFIVNSIHDSTISEVAPDEKEAVKSISIQAFTQDVYSYLEKVYGIKFDVVLGVGVKQGQFWSEGEEEKIDVAPSGWKLLHEV